MEEESVQDINEVFSKIGKYDESCFNEMVGMFKKTSGEIHKLEKKYKRNTSQREKLNNMKSNLGQYIIENTYKFEVNPQKSEYNSGEDIIIDITLTNNLSKKEELQVFKNVFPFNIYVTSDGNENFVNSSKTDNEKTTLILQGNETKSWKLNLSKETSSVMNATKIGKYNFSKTGKYYISSFGIDMNLNSNQAQFIIK